MFLWPDHRHFRALARSLTPVSSERIEAALANMFPGYSPVLVSSGRTGLELALEHLQLGRSDLVGIFPFASLCVLEAVSRVATPLAGPSTLHAPHRLIFHQWGFVQEHHGTASIVIEDAVDSLCAPGCQLMPAGGNHEVWSLPKIIGSLSGGVIWCRHANDAAKIRLMREGRKQGTELQWLLRWMGTWSSTAHAYWSGVEASKGPLSRLGSGEVWNLIHTWNHLVADRREKLALLKPFIPSWLPEPDMRLPCVVPISIDPHQASHLTALGINSGFRHYERIHADGRRELVKMFPIPIHQDVSMEWLLKVRTILESF
ncbi:MAG: putative PLP-dependent aminotransferase [Magnetococcales bacterium]|nr:putative PLP-dependent aminotransferase [Magnetococcales bacterium]